MWLSDRLQEISMPEMNDWSDNHTHDFVIVRSVATTAMNAAAP